MDDESFDTESEIIIEVVRILEGKSVNLAFSILSTIMEFIGGEVGVDKWESRGLIYHIKIEKKDISDEH